MSTINAVDPVPADTSEQSAHERHFGGHQHLHGAFGDDPFGALAERIALFFGTPTYIMVQTAIVIVWVGLNAVGVAFAWDLYPFVFLNLAFSLQAAYAAPLILLAQTRSAEREKHAEKAAADHRDEVANQHSKLIEENTHLTKDTQALTNEVKALTEEIKTLTEKVSSALNRP
ncbi:MAG: DUF1003 domain-containing protein [Actinobacteria bacterium]|uniref:Unannotated protein n=1 Tax=freshwater metagenome TaxID=449393 RepID=A0A6J7EJ03_9ZZZZ|nr:DUF1003 domain-containing protein [Actinomycetota bacterium]